MKGLRIVACLAALLTAAPAVAKSPFAGHYRFKDGPDVVAELILKEDGRFEYGLAAGALDEQSAGRWVEADGKVTLHTEPKPKPPVFSAGAQAKTAEAPFKLLVTWPNGRGVAGVDFKLGFDSGEPLMDYTQDYGWTQPADDKRVPRWIELTEPIHRISSPRFRIDMTKGNAVTYVLTPNDLGVVDFDGAVIERVEKPAADDPDILLHRREGVMKFMKLDRADRPRR
ncbi:MAG: hypothetical protein V4530_01180 [Pseudomonadota bacterium]